MPHIKINLQNFSCTPYLFIVSQSELQVRHSLISLPFGTIILKIFSRFTKFLAVLYKP
jgi:hypothetical protein